MELVDKLVELIKSSSNNWEQRDGCIKLITTPEDNNTWRFIKPEIKLNCTLYKAIIYNGFCVKFLPREEWFVPEGCQGCYKVVVRPRDIGELFDLEALMWELDYPSKCGCEMRTFVKGLYGGYFYNCGLEKGLERCEEIRKLMPETPMHLKRGCTELEINHGPSDKWEVTDAQREIEAEIEKQILVDPMLAPQTPEEVVKVYASWFDFAWKLDPRYEGEDRFSKCVTYG